MVDGAALVSFMGAGKFNGGVVSADELALLDDAASAATALVKTQVSPRDLNATPVQYAIKLLGVRLYERHDKAFLITFGETPNGSRFDADIEMLLAPYKMPGWAA